MSVQSNISSDFLWLATRETNCQLLRRPAGVGDLSTCALNPTGVNSRQYSAVSNAKHASVTADPKGEGFVYHQLTRRNVFKPAKRYTSKQVNNLKPGQVDRFRKLVKHELGRRDLNTALFKKASRILFTQRKARKATPAKKN